MNDLTTIADCSALGMVVSGAPVSGSMAVYLGAGTITSGNLSGDISVSGGTNSTLSATGVVPGKYGNAVMSTDTAGRISFASAGGNRSLKTEASWTVPTKASFTWTNQGALTMAADSALGISLQDNVASDPGGFRILDKAAPATPWSVYARISSDLTATPDGGQTGIVVRNSISGRFLEAGPYAIRPGSFIIQHWQNPIGYDSQVAKGFVRKSPPYWMRISNDGVNLTVSLSGDGITWEVPILSETLSSFIVSIDRIGFGVRRENAPTGMTLNSFSLVAPIP